VPDESGSIPLLGSRPAFHLSAHWGVSTWRVGPAHFGVDSLFKHLTLHHTSHRPTIALLVGNPQQTKNTLSTIELGGLHRLKSECPLADIASRAWHSVTSRGSRSRSAHSLLPLVAQARSFTSGMGSLAAHIPSSS